MSQLLDILELDPAIGDVIVIGDGPVRVVMGGGEFKEYPRLAASDAELERLVRHLATQRRRPFSPEDITDVEGSG